jgi:hypothetical protein
MEANMITSTLPGAPPRDSGRLAKSIDASSACPTGKKSEQTDCCKQKSRSFVKALRERSRNGSSSGARFTRRSQAGWSPERRVRQAELIRRFAPWRHSTGPKTKAGKARCAKNALRHGSRSGSRIRELQRIRYALRLAADNIRKVRLLIRLHQNTARTPIKHKPLYGRRPSRIESRLARLRLLVALPLQG